MVIKKPEYKLFIHNIQYAPEACWCFEVLMRGIWVCFNSELCLKRKRHKGIVIMHSHKTRGIPFSDKKYNSTKSLKDMVQNKILLSDCTINIFKDAIKKKEKIR